MQRISKQFLRENFLGLSLTMIGVVCLALAGVTYMGHRAYPHFALADGAGLEGSEIDLLEKQNKAYEKIAEAVTPAVVNISTTKIIKVQQSPFMMDPFFRNFFGDMFGGAVPREQREHALGSGVIVSNDGYILTNNHVVSKASDIRVLLSDKRSFKGKVVGADPDTDLAVVKIDGKNLPTAALGDSSALHVGDIVMAFGNPFGLNFTVTRGSVSALNRSSGGAEKLGQFIQTDAAINPGNSGGALVNVRGQVVGVPTFILSGNSGPGGEGGFMGIGFAIPANTAKHVMQDLIKSGKVTRGFIGASIRPLSPEMAKQFNVPDTSGALVEDVTADGPADKAGLKVGDVVRKVNGQAVEDSNQLINVVTTLDPGTQATLDILRDGKPLALKVTIGERPANLPYVANGRNPGTSQGTLRGITVQNLTPEIRDQLGLGSNTQGVVISDIDPNSPAGSILQRGDVIQSIARQPVRNTSDFQRLASQAKGDVLLRVNRNGASQFVVISPSNGGDQSGGDDDDSQ